MSIENWFFKQSVKFEFGAENRKNFYIKLGQFLENGVSLSNALGQLAKVTKKGDKSTMGKLYLRWQHDVANGVNFGKCLSEYVPLAEAMLLESGAETGHLVQALNNSASAVEQQSKVKGAIVSGGAYPMLLIGMLVAALMLSSHVVIPTFADVMPVEDWQGISKTVAEVSLFIRDYTMVFGLGILLMIIGISMSMPRWSGAGRARFDNVVPWNLYRMWQGSSFLLAVSSMMAAGIKIDENSLGRIIRGASPYVKKRVNSVRRWVSAGENLGEALHKAGYKFPDEALIQDLRIYANLRGFDQNIERITRTWVDDIVKKVSVSMKLMNVVVLFLIAVTIGCLILALYGVIQQIKQESG